MPQSHTRQPLAAERLEWVQTCQFDAGQLTSDGGLAWVQQADADLALCAALAAQIPDWRRRPVRHALETLVRQRVFQIVCGYEDQDDADTLRTDPLLKLVCGLIPDRDADDLASQPTLSRLENAVNPRTCYRLATALLAVYLRERERHGGITAHLLLEAGNGQGVAHIAHAAHPIRQCLSPSLGLARGHRPGQGHDALLHAHLDS